MPFRNLSNESLWILKNHCGISNVSCGKKGLCLSFCASHMETYPRTWTSNAVPEWWWHTQVAQKIHGTLSFTRIFARLKRYATTDALKRLVDYIQRIWTDSNIWPPVAWSVYLLSVRTNSDLEGWHNCLNSRARPQMPLHLLVTLLHDEVSVVSIQIRLVLENKLRCHQHLKYRNMKAKIFRYWDSY